MNTIHNLSIDITIILIAHRLGTVQSCDNIFLLDKGKLVAQGNYNELLENKII